jgi:putative ABC transport system permease protein
VTSFGLIVRGVLHDKPRAVFTLGSVVVAFVLFGLLMPLQRLLHSRIDLANANRLVVTNKASMMRPLPVIHGERIAQVPNVALVSHFTYFGAFYREPSNPIAALVTDVAKFPAMVDEVEFRNAAERDRWTKDPTGVAVGRQLANRMNWKVGDLVPLYSTIYPRADGNPVWTFRVSAIFDAVGKDGNSDSMIVDYGYFDAVRAFGKGTVGWFALRIGSPAASGATAQAIDALFVNSHDETSTVTEKAFAQSFLRQVGDFGSMIAAALGLVFWTLALITANTMAHSIRERFSQIALLKALGFSEERVVGIVVGESLLLMGAGGCFGMLLALAAVPIIASQTAQLLSTLSVSWTDWALGLALMVGLGVMVALVPVVQAIRQSAIDGLCEAVA